MWIDWHSLVLWFSLKIWWERGDTRSWMLTFLSSVQVWKTQLTFSNLTVFLSHLLIVLHLSGNVVSWQWLWLQSISFKKFPSAAAQFVYFGRVISKIGWVTTVRVVQSHRQKCAVAWGHGWRQSSIPQDWKSWILHLTYRWSQFLIQRLMLLVVHQSQVNLIAPQDFPSEAVWWAQGHVYTLVT